MSKEMWIAAHEQLIEEYLEEHPDATEKEASDITAKFASDRAGDIYSGMVDRAKDLAKEI